MTTAREVLQNEFRKRIAREVPYQQRKRVANYLLSEAQAGNTETRFKLKDLDIPEDNSQDLISWLKSNGLHATKTVIQPDGYRYIFVTWE